MVSKLFMPALQQQYSHACGTSSY